MKEQTASPGPMSMVYQVQTADKKRIAKDRDRAGMYILSAATDKDDAAMLLDMLGINPAEIGKDPEKRPEDPGPRSRPRKRYR